MENSMLQTIEQGAAGPFEIGSDAERREKQLTLKGVLSEQLLRTKEIGLSGTPED